MMRMLTLAGIIATFVGCRPTIVVNDITVIEADYIKSRDVVMQQAAKQLDCARDQLETRLVDVTVHADVLHIEVSGCGRSAVYERDHPAGNKFKRSNAAASGS